MALSRKVYSAPVASTVYSLDSITAQLRAVCFRHISPCPANLGQHFAASVARLVGTDAILSETSGLLLGSQSHLRSLSGRQHMISWSNASDFAYTCADYRGKSDTEGD